MGYKTGFVRPGHILLCFQKVSLQVSGKFCNYRGNRDDINKKQRYNGGSLHLQIF